MARGGGRPRGKGQCESEVGRRHADAATKGRVPGAPIQLAFDLARNARDLRAMNRRKPGGSTS